MTFWRRSVAVAVSTIFWLAVSGASRPAETRTGNALAAERSIARRFENCGVPNAGEVTRICIAGRSRPRKDLEALANMGVDIVVDLRGSSKEELERVNKLGMQYVASHALSFSEDEAFARFLELIRQNPARKFLCTADWAS